MNRRILVLLKPNVIQQKQDIIKRIKACGYTIIQSKDVILTLEQEANFYATKCQLNLSYPIIAGELADKPICALYLSHPAPDSGTIRHLNRLQNLVFDKYGDNLIYVSENCPMECAFIFGEELFGNMNEKPSIECVSQYLNRSIHPVLIQALQDISDDNLNADNGILRLAQQLIKMKLTEGVLMPDYSKYEHLMSKIYKLDERLKRE